MTEGTPRRSRPSTPAELRARFGPPPARRPLGEAQVEDLRRRLNADPGLTMNPDEHRAYYTLGIVRDLPDVDALVRQVGNEALDTDGASRSRHYAAGILDAVAWARGDRDDAPVTGTPSKARSASTGEMHREATDASEVMQGVRICGHPGEYVTGVEATLLWLLCMSDAHPWNV